MSVNPNPDHITAEMWWFVDELELLDPSDTVFAGAWGNNKPGYHCDYRTLKNTSGWQNDYSVQLADDKVPAPHVNERMGAAVDWTFHSAQAGNFSNIKKYGQRIRTAWQNKDPRLKGWREVLCNADSDSGADGYDFVYWTERTPDSTHKWHFHFSCLRKYVNVLAVFQAMISILKGETLAQWQAGGDEEMPTSIWREDGYWLCQGGKRELIKDNDDYSKAQQAYPTMRVLPSADHNGWPTAQLTWSEDEVDRILGRRYEPPSSGGVSGDGASTEEVRTIVHDELKRLKMVSDME